MTSINDIDTPAVLIDLDNAEANLRRAQDFADRHEEKRADDRTKQRADATDDRREQNVGRARDVENLRREKIVGEERKEDAADRRHAGRNEQCRKTCAKRSNADGACGIRILAHRQPRVTQSRSHAR